MKAYYINSLVFQNKATKKTGNGWPFLLMMAAILITGGCTADEKSDAYGQFEAIETTISSEVSGKLIHFQVDEGYEFKPGQRVGNIDTTSLVLQREELESQLETIKTRIPGIDAETAVQQENLQAAQKDLKRIQQLLKDEAATQKDLDDTETRVRTIQKQIEALQVQKQSVYAEVNSVRPRIRQIENRIADATIINPLKGTVLVSFAKPFEMVQAGQPLYRIAGLDTLLLRVYVSGARLPNVKLGQQVDVLVDKNAEENQSLKGRVSWIASEAEFTPKMIQTKEERVTQVYAVEVKVPNPDGILKIGMPGEVNF